MSDAEVELVRGTIERFNREGPAALTEVFHPDAVSHPFPEWPDQSVYNGAEGAAKLAAQWTELFDDYRWVVQRVIDAGDSVVVLAVHGGRARGSGIETSSPVGAVFSGFRDGLVAEVHYFLTWDEALVHGGVAVNGTAGDD